MFEMSYYNCQDYGTSQTLKWRNWNSSLDRNLVHSNQQRVDSLPSDWSRLATADANRRSPPRFEVNNL